MVKRTDLHAWLINSYWTLPFFRLCSLVRFFCMTTQVQLGVDMLSLVQYHKLSITIFLKEKTRKTYRYSHYFHSRNVHGPRQPMLS